MRQIECAYRKARLSDAQKNYFLFSRFVLSCQNKLSRGRGKPAVRSPRKNTRRAGGGFSPLRRAVRGSPFFYARRIHLHPYAHKGKEAKMRFCLVLSLFGIKMPRLHLSCKSRRYAANGVRGRKSVVFLAREFFRKKYPKFYILHSTFYICAVAARIV